MSLISIKNLTFAYEGTYENIFSNVNLNLDTNWKLALIGRNGRGKTTLLKLLLGELKAKGSINAQVEFMYFPYDITSFDMCTLDIAKNVCPQAEQWEIKRELNLMNVKSDVLYRPFDTLSPGEQSKMMLCLMFLKENSFLLIDEPTNHLDMAAREVLGKYLNSKSGFILVSHDRALVDMCSDHILSINKTDIELIKGNFSTWLENSKYRELSEKRSNERLATQIERLNLAGERSGGWSEKLEATKYNHRISGLRPDRGYIGAKSAKMMKQKKNFEKRIERSVEEKKTLLKNVERQDDLKIISEEHFAKKLVEFTHVDIFYGENCICRDICFSLEKGQRLALLGHNGSGKSSILKIIMGENINFTGSVYIAPSLKKSYVAQTEELSGKLDSYIKQYAINEPVFKAMLNKFGFSPEDYALKLEDYSEGRKRKVTLARSISEEANLYVWDEPLNYIDVISRMRIENVIRNDEPSMLFVEHDRAFCENLSAEIVYVGTENY